MARVFISHANEDLSVVMRIDGWLRQAGHVVFLDHDLESGLRVGDVWARRLFDELYRADALLGVVSTAFVRSPWCAAEVGIALANGLHLLPVKVEPGASHRLMTDDLQWVVLDEDGDRARVAILDTLRTIDGAGGAPWSSGLPVYPGLDAFSAGQARVFFGRDQESQRLAERLRAPVRAAERGLLAVVGPSGSGKSSLVRAGLIPRLARDRDWLVLPTLVPAASPVADPVGELARVVAGSARARGLDWTVGQVSEDLSRPGGITRLAAELLADAAPARHLLLVIDQAEELLSPETPENARRQFASLLLEATGGPVRAVATIRTEFLDPLSVLGAESGLPVATFLVRPLTRDMLSLVITGPARHAGIRVDDELVARMVDNTGSGEALPLLAYVLNQLSADVERGGILSAERYEALGGVRGAVARQADEALTEAAATTGRAPAEVLGGLLRLVTVNEEGQPTRRRATLNGLPGHVRTELGVFVDRRLLTIHQPGVHGDNGASPVIDIAHEQILTAWQPLAEAIEAASDTLRLQADVTDAAATWDRDKRPVSHLWELERARRALGELSTQELSSTTREFLTVSRRHGERRRVRTISILTALLVLVTAGGLTALVQWNSAVNERERAVERERRATARGLLPQAALIRDSDPTRALKLALAAHALDPSAESRQSLQLTLAATPWVASRDEGQAVWSVAFSPDGRTLATTSSTGGDGGSRLRLWDVTDPHDPTELATRDDDQNLDGVAFSPDGHTLATTSWTRVQNGGRLRLWDVTDPNTPTELATRDDDQYVRSVAFSPDGRTLATTTEFIERHGGRLRLWDVTNPNNPAELATRDDDQNLDGVAFSPDGRTLATTSRIANRDGGRLRLWDVTDPHTPTELATRDDDQNLAGVAFSPDGRTLATTSWIGDRNSRLRLWDVTDPHTPTELATRDDDQNLEGMAFSPDGRTLATTSSTENGGRLRLWDVTDPHTPAELATRDDDQYVRSVAFSPDGGTLATTTELTDRDGGRLSLRAIDWATDLRSKAREWACTAGNGGFTSEDWDEAVLGIAHEESC